MQSRGKFSRFLGAISHFFHAHAGSLQGGISPNVGGSRPYKLYVPRKYTGMRSAPLLVALHGCTQDVDNFATGTQFNALADAYNFLVLYPQQTSNANRNLCWNWFNPNNQMRGRGEPAILVAMIDDVMSRYTIDSRRIYITGLSAGGAMAVIMGVCYPDYFAAVGVHSGLEYKAASSLLGAPIAMARGGPDPNTQGRLAYLSAGNVACVLPIIVFQGTADATVAPVNGDQVIQQFIAMNDYADDGLKNNSISSIPGTVEAGQVPGGYAYSLSTYTYQGQTLMQYYKINGMGHTWSGGSPIPPATFIDPNGPNASLLMWNFFTAHSKKTPSTSAISQGK